MFPCNNKVRDELNLRSGIVSEHLTRQIITPRADYETVLQKQFMWYYNEPALNWTECEQDPYWSETGMAEIS